METSETPVMTLVEYQKFWQSHFDCDNGDFLLLGQRFTEREVARSLDVYAELESCGLFSLPLEELPNFFESGAPFDPGAKLVLAIILPPDVAGSFLLAEDDSRLIHVCRKRIKNQEHRLDIDCDLEY